MRSVDKTAFVLAGGGSLGATQVGMLRVLTQHGIVPDFVIGTSAGAINAVHFAANPTSSGVDQLERYWLQLRSTEVFPRWRARGVVLALLARRSSLLDPRGLSNTLAAKLPVRLLEETRIPCHVVATDLASGSQVLLSRGSALDALLASAAIPVVFPPRSHEGRLLVDGSIAENTPVASAIALGATRVVVLPTGFPCSQRRMPTSLVATALHISSLLVARQLAVDLVRLRTSARLHVVPPLCPIHVAPSDFSHARTLIDDATAQTAQWISAGGLERDELPMTVAPHSHSPMQG